MKYLLPCILLCACFRETAAFNHPEIEWKTVTTTHFRINYYDRTEPAVYATWKIAEAAYVKLAALYGYTFVDKIDISLADYDDYSNGWASWTDRSIGIWLPDARFDLRGTTTWLRNVITHEIAHIMSMEKEKGMQLVAWGLLFDYVSPSLNLTLTEPVPFMTTMPKWLVEGTAQMGAGRLGNDCWDSRRDMLLRCAALENRLLSLDEMAHFTHDWVGNEMVYNQGYSFCAYLEDRFGAEQVASVWKRARERKLFGLDVRRMLETEFGTSAERLHTAWRDSVSAAARAAAPEPAAVTVLWDRATRSTLPRVSPDGRLVGFFTNNGDDSRRTDLVIIDRHDGGVAARIRYAKVCWRFGPGVKQVYYIKSRDPNTTGSFFNDIYSFDLSRRRESRLTSSARVYDFDITRDGSRACCVRFADGAFGIEMLDLTGGAFTPLFGGRIGEPFLGLSFNPRADDSLVVARVVDGAAGLYIADVPARTFEPLVATLAQEQEPYWAEDGRIYFSADYDGIFNIYSVRPDGSDLRRHSSVVGGAFCPQRGPDGDMVISEYTAEGFRISQCRCAGEAFELPRTARCTFEALPSPTGTVTMKPREYEARMGRPVWQLSSAALFFDSSDAVRRSLAGGQSSKLIRELQMAFATGMVMERSDALGKKRMMLGAAAQLIPSYVDLSGADSMSAGNRALSRVPNPDGARRASRPASVRHSLHYDRPALCGGLERSGMMAGAVAQRAVHADSAGDSSFIPIPSLVPFFVRENHTRAPSFGIDVQAMLILMNPVAFAVSPYMEYRLGRDVYCGVTPVASIAPMALLAGTGVDLSVPLWIDWFRYGYYNQDVQYNLGDVTSLNVFINPGVSPVSRIEKQYDGSDTTVTDTAYLNLGYFMIGTEFQHGFPVLRYASILIGTQDYLVLQSREWPDPWLALDSSSTTYAKLGLDVRFVMPLVRNINRGRLYGDNLYAHAFYDFALYGDGGYFGAPSLSVIANPDADVSGAAVFHTVGAGLDFGFIKKYLFTRKLSASVAWEFFHRRFNLTVRMLM